MSPYTSILEATRNMSFVKDEPMDVSNIGSDIETVRQDLTFLDSLFREYLDNKINKQYDDSSFSPSKKPTRKEKIYGLLNYLTHRFAAEVSIAFEEGGQIDLIGITENDSVLRDPSKIMSIMYPNYPKSNIPLIVKSAKDLATFAVKNSDPFHYDLVYYTIKSKIMFLSASISTQEYYSIVYKTNLQLHTVDDSGSEGIDFNVPSSVWLIPQNLMLLSITLYVIGSKIR